MQGDIVGPAHRPRWVRTAATTQQGSSCVHQEGCVLNSRGRSAAKRPQLLQRQGAWQMGAEEAPNETGAAPMGSQKPSAPGPSMGNPPWNCSMATLGPVLPGVSVTLSPPRKGNPGR